MRDTHWCKSTRLKYFLPFMNGVLGPLGVSVLGTIYLPVCLSVCVPVCRLFVYLSVI